MLADWLTLLKVQGDDGVELDSEDEEQQCSGLETKDRLEYVESTGTVSRSSMTFVVSEKHENTIEPIHQYFHKMCSIRQIINIKT